MSPTGLSPALVPFSKGLRLALIHSMSPAPQPRAVSRPVWALPRSLAATEGISVLISLPAGTEMFQFPGSLAGIPGSKLVGQLPRTFRGLPRPPSDDA